VSRPLRLLTVSWEYPPLRYGGLGRHVHALSAAQAAAGLDVTVLTQGPSPAVGALGPQGTTIAQEAGVRVVRVAPDPPGGDAHVDPAGFADALQWAQVRAGVRLPRPDVVHAHDWVSAHAGVVLAAAHDVPLVATIHATEAGLWQGWVTQPASRRRHETERWLVGAASRTLVCSNAMRDEVVAALGAQPDRVDIVSNGVDRAAWRVRARARSAAREAAGVPATAPLLVLPGRVEWEKGADLAVAALTRVRRRLPGAMLVVAGAGSRTADVAAQARRLRVARAVRLVGHCPDRQLAGLLGAADVVLVPSRYEPFGLVALEAMAAGTPVVAAAVGGLADIVTDGRTGLLVPPDDASALAAAATRVLGETALRRRLTRTAAAELPRRWTWAGAAAATQHSYAAARALGPLMVPAWTPDPDAPDRVPTRLP
jgi:glycogen(starch) synthase